MPWYAAAGSKQTQKYWMLSWCTRIFPFLEQENIWRQTDVEEDNPQVSLPNSDYPWDNQRFLGL